MEDDLEFPDHYARLKLCVLGRWGVGVVHRGLPMQMPEEGTACGDARCPVQLHPALGTGAGDLNSGPHGCAASTPTSCY